MPELLGIEFARGPSSLISPLEGVSAPGAVTQDAGGSGIVH
ncbi:MAG: hypothetical protein ABSG25_05330 [Bryobacteraceae bacterium]